MKIESILSMLDSFRSTKVGASKTIE